MIRSTTSLCNINTSSVNYDQSLFSDRLTVRANVKGSRSDDVFTPGGVIGSVAAPLFNEYLLAFELTSVVLLAAIMGAVVLAKKRS